jgi:hypothetical protein
MIINKQYWLLWIPLILIFLTLRIGGIQMDTESSCKHEHIIHTKEYDYCMMCGKKAKEKKVV